MVKHHLAHWLYVKRSASLSLYFVTQFNIQKVTLYSPDLGSDLGLIKAHPPLFETWRLLLFQNALTALRLSVKVGSELADLFDD